MIRFATSPGLLSIELRGDAFRCVWEVRCS